MILKLSPPGAKVLRTRARDVLPPGRAADQEAAPGRFALVEEATLNVLLRDLFDTCDAHDGAGLAAPQVGVGLRVAVVVADGLRLALVNPRIVKSSAEFETREEGCLSLPGVTAFVRRPRKVTVLTMGRTWNLSGLAARAAQHEIDHLDGVLITDKPGAARLSGR